MIGAERVASLGVDLDKWFAHSKTLTPTHVAIAKTEIGDVVTVQSVSVPRENYPLFKDLRRLSERDNVSVELLNETMVASDWNSPNLEAWCSYIEVCFVQSILVAASAVGNDPQRVEACVSARVHAITSPSFANLGVLSHRVLMVAAEIFGTKVHPHTDALGVVSLPRNQVAALDVSYIVKQ